MKTTHTLPLLMGLMVATTTLASPQSVDWNDRQIFAHSNQDGPIRIGPSGTLHQDLSWLDRPLDGPTWASALPSTETRPYMVPVDTDTPAWRLDKDPLNLLATMRQQHPDELMSPQPPMEAPLQVPGPGALTVLGLGLLGSRRRRHR